LTDPSGSIEPRTLTTPACRSTSRQRSARISPWRSPA
jgi:hypothetical protein